MGAPIVRPYQDIRKAIKGCLRKKRPFTMTIQNETISFESKWGSGTNRQSKYSIDDINFIKSVKQHIIKKELHLDYIGYEIPGDGKVQYFLYNQTLEPGQIFKNVVNIDLSGAYWETAYKLGLVSESIYQKGLTVDKFVRLTAIGSLAKKVYKYEFDGKRQSKKEVISSEETEMLWDVICVRVSEILQEAAALAGKGFIFFWVDGIYVSKDAVNVVSECFKKHGYKFKIDTGITKITIEEKKLYVFLKNPIKRLLKGKEVLVNYKPFPFRKNISGGHSK